MSGNLEPRPYVCFRGERFRVVGVTVPAPEFRREQDAQAWLADHFATLPPSKQPKQRRCLSCGSSFLSMGFHNRMCDRCRSGSDALGEEVRPALPKARGRA